MINKQFIFHLLFLLSIGCTNKVENTIQDEPKIVANRIVLIVDNAPVNSSYTWPDGVGVRNVPSYEIRYIDDHFIPRLYTPKLVPERDTLVLPTTREVIEIQHAYLGLDNLSFLFQNGDSVLFTYKGNKPTATVLNREVKDWDINYGLRKRDLICGDNFPGVVRIVPMIAFRDSAFKKIKDWDERSAIAIKVGFTAAVQELEAEIRLLDSLKNNELVAPLTYQFYKEKATYDLANQQFFYKLPEEAYAIEQMLSVDQMRHAVNDSLKFSFYHDRLLSGLRQHYFDKQIKTIRTSNARYTDYRQVYDSVRQSSLLSDPVRKMILFRTVDKLMSVFSLEDRERYWQKFQEDVSDSKLTEYINTKYKISKGASNELLLSSLSGEESSFTEVLSKHRGKVVYVDFWASWCAPCIRAMPASSELHEAYRNKEVAFIYLSMDEDSDKWKKAAHKHGLNDSLTSFVINNQYTSRMLDDLQVESIPRYLLYDKEGKLVHENAPGPGSEEIRKLINQYLTEDRAELSSL